MIKIQKYLNFPISPGYYHRWMESGGGIELKKKKRNKFRALRERWCGGLKLLFSLLFVNKLNIPIHNYPNWLRDDFLTLKLELNEMALVFKI